MNRGKTHDRDDDVPIGGYNVAKLLKVYDTLTKEYVEVEVSEEVYKAYTRTEWNIDKQDNSFEQHEIMFCELKGGVENFDEMTSDEDMMLSL